MRRLLALFQMLDLRLSVASIAAGASLGVGALFFDLWFLSLTGFAGVLYVMRTKEHQAIWPYLTLIGAIAYGCSFYPLFWSTLPLDWLGLGPWLGVGIIASVWLVTVLVFSLSFASLLRLARGQLHTRASLLLLPASLYVLADAFGTFLFSVVLSGPAGTVGLDFSMGSLGYQLADSPLLLQTAWFGGIYALVWTQAFFGALLYCALTLFAGRRRMVLVGAWIGVWLLLSAGALSPLLSSTDATDDTLLVGVVSTYDEAQTQSTKVEQISTSLDLLPAPVDVVVLPEGTEFVYTLGGSSGRISQTKQSARYVLDSATIATPAGLAAQTQLLNTHDLTSATSSKAFLMVFGEYVPWLYRAIAAVIGQSEVVAKLDTNHGYLKETSRTFMLDQSRISARLCSDGMSPFLYARDTSQGATVLFNLASHGWFHQSKQMHDLAIRVGQVRAVESGRWYVRAGHDSPSFVIDQVGQVQVTGQWLVADPLVIEVPQLSTQTPYSQLRGWVLVVSFLLALALVYPTVRARIAGRRNSSNQNT